MKTKGFTLIEFFIAIAMVSILLLIAIPSLHRSRNTRNTSVPAPREKYYRGDVVELCIGPKAFIAGKVYNGTWGYGTGWKYEVSIVGGAGGITNVWVNEIEIEKVIKESPTRPKAEAQ